MSAMKTLFHAFRLPVFAVLALSATSRSGEFDTMIEELQNSKPYLSPFATLFGSASNSGWYQSSKIDEGFGFYLGLPLSMIKVSDNDRSYSAVFVDEGCRAFHQVHAGDPACQDQVKYTTPTIMGVNEAPIMRTTLYDRTQDTLFGTSPVLKSDGVGSVAGMNAIPFLLPQIGVSWKNTELKIRYVGAPTEEVSVHMPGFGLQHSFTHLLPKNYPFSISLASNFSWFMADWKIIGDNPDNYSGTLELGGFSHFLGVLAGYTYLRRVEIFFEAGWERSVLNAQGSFTKTENNLPQTVVIDLNGIDGRNAFRFAVNFAVHLGYEAVFGQNYGANSGNQFSVLSYRYR